MPNPAMLKSINIQHCKLHYLRLQTTQKKKKKRKAFQLHYFVQSTFIGYAVLRLNIEALEETASRPPKYAAVAMIEHLLYILIIGSNQLLIFEVKGLILLTLFRDTSWSDSFHANSFLIAGTMRGCRQPGT